MTITPQAMNEAIGFIITHEDPESEASFASILQSEYPAHLASVLSTIIKTSMDGFVSQGADPLVAMGAAVEYAVSNVMFVAFLAGRHYERKESAEFWAVLNGLEATDDSDARDPDIPDSEPTRTDTD